MKKNFDCVEMKRRGAMRIHERLKGMSIAQQVQYWHERTEAFRAEQQVSQASGKTPDK